MGLARTAGGVRSAAAPAGIGSRPGAGGDRESPARALWPLRLGQSPIRRIAFLRRAAALAPAHRRPLRLCGLPAQLAWFVQARAGGRGSPGAQTSRMESVAGGWAGCAAGSVLGRHAGPGRSLRPTLGARAGFGCKRAFEPFPRREEGPLATRPPARRRSEGAAASGAQAAGARQGRERGSGCARGVGRRASAAGESNPFAHRHASPAAREQQEQAAPLLLPEARCVALLGRRPTCSGGRHGLGQDHPGHRGVVGPAGNWAGRARSAHCSSIAEAAMGARMASRQSVPSALDGRQRRRTPRTLHVDPPWIPGDQLRAGGARFRRHRGLESGPGDLG